MEWLTLNQIAIALAFLVGLITSVSYLISKLKTWITNTLKTEFDGIKREIKAVNDKVNSVDLESCKNYLVTYLSNVEKGHSIDEIEKERFYEQYQHYTKAGGNSYIRRKVEQLESSGKL